MGIKVFLSWSGDVSRRLAEVIREWLPSALQMVQPYFTPSDIEKGAKWSGEIAKELEAAHVGVLCLTKDNVKSEWLLFEAGALSKRLDRSRVCPLLFGVGDTDLVGPLRQFQATEFGEAEMRKLMKTINSAAGEEKLPDSILANVFEKWWPDLEQKINGVMQDAKAAAEAPPRSEREILEEILGLSRLSVRRLSDRRGINPAAIRDLLKTYLETYERVTGNAETGQVLQGLQQMRDPLVYLVQRSMERDPDLPALLEQLTSLSFEYSIGEEDSPF